jgi:hypothetical protein
MGNAREAANGEKCSMPARLWFLPEGTQAMKPLTPTEWENAWKTGRKQVCLADRKALVEIIMGLLGFIDNGHEMPFDQYQYDACTCEVVSVARVAVEEK